MKVIIYGLGEGRVFVEKSLDEGHEIVGYTDSFAQIDVFHGKRYIALEHLAITEFDYIIIAVTVEKVSREIRNALVHQWGVAAGKIIEFLHVYQCMLPYQKVDRVMQNPVMQDENGYDGMVLGISHAAWGVNPSFLDGNVCNLAVGSQDLYYNYKTFEYCKSKYAEKIKNLKYMVLEFYDYTYFNYDTSLSRVAIEYFVKGGYFEDLHNYASNKNFKEDALTEVRKWVSNFVELDVAEKELYSMLFKDFYKENNYYSYHDFPDVKCELDVFGLNEYQKRLIMKESGNIVNGWGNVEALLEDGLNNGKKRHENTIKENLGICRKWFKSIYELNPQMKVYVILIPRYKMLEDVFESLYDEWKKEFYITIEMLQHEFPFVFMDYKGNHKISGNPRFYKDYVHLNYEGACAFTSLLKDDMRKYR